jgi:hypothetical protein
MRAVDQKIANGYPDGTFRPGANITHSEMIVMVIKASGLPIDKNAKPGFADDNDIPGWAKSYAATAKSYSITDYIKDNRFEPKVLATRAEAISAILKMLETLLI